jgi:hypothetical protein
MQQSKSYRLELGQSFDDLLQRIAHDNNTSKEEIIYRAINLYAYLRQKVDSVPGGRVVVTDATGKPLTQIDLE